jgi:phenylalanyl-tRNA synthetase beta chain
MFKFSFNWLNELCGNNIAPDELFDILNLQGFEVKETEHLENDKIITIEVKANRADMLSHIGIAREVCAFKNMSIPKIDKANLKEDNNSFPINIKFANDHSCRRFSGIIINNIDNRVSTPEYIKNRLEKLGVNCINAVVDIVNYIMLELGQPMHTYDIDKLSENTVSVCKSDVDDKIITLGNKEAQIKKGDIVISNNNKILCVAGIIGTESSTVDTNTKNILLESAVFDEISVRLTSRHMKISTPSSFRFERGVNIDSTKDVAYICVKKINEICGGDICKILFDYYPDKVTDNILPLRCSRANELIGCGLTADQMVSFLERYDFRCKKDGEDNIIVIPPMYRSDVLKEVDIIEEITRIYGYDNIKPIMPTIQVQYSKNYVWDNVDILRNILVGLGFNEVINYAFIPADITKFLGVQKDHFLYSDLKLQNAISPMYCLMRPTLVYSLISSLSYNYSRNNTDLSLFEIGRVYFKDENKDTGCSETDTLGIILSGNRLERGWGIDKDIKYTYYDLLNYVNLLFNEFGRKFDLKKENYPFFEDSSGYSIINENGIRIGFLGEIKKEEVKNIQNIKLIRDKVFYFETYIKYFNNKNKLLKFESKFPNVKRRYNLLCKKDVLSKDIVNEIRASSALITSAVIKDVYYDKNILSDSHAILYEVEYCSKEYTLTSEEISKIEEKFLNSLILKFGITIKK